MIAVDVHDVCADYVLGMIQIFGQPAQWSTPLEDMFPFADRAALKDPHVQAEFMKTLNPMPNAAEVLWRFKLLGIDFFYYSAAPDTEEVSKSFRWWLQNHGFPPSYLTILNNKQGKIDLLKDSDLITMIIEDDPDIIVKAANMGKTAIVFDRPWNNMIESSYRAIGWRHLYGLVAGFLGIFHVPNEPKWIDYE